MLARDRASEARLRGVSGTLCFFVSCQCQPLPLPLLCNPLRCAIDGCRGRIKGTVLASTDTVSCLREFMQRSSDPEQYAPEYIPQIAASVQPLIFAKTKNGLRCRCSVDHISNIVKKAISAASIPTMKPRHLQGASTSKIVALSPEAMAVAMGLGRWTTLTLHSSEARNEKNFEWEQQRRTSSNSRSLYGMHCAQQENDETGQGTTYCLGLFLPHWEIFLSEQNLLE